MVLLCSLETFFVRKQVVKAPPSCSVLISELKKYELRHPESESCSILPPELPVTDPFGNGISMIGPFL